MRLKLLTRKAEAGDAASFLFEAPKQLSWKAGQYLVYTLLHPNPDNRGIKRYFTIASAPFEKNILITTRVESKKGSSFKKALMRLAQGSTLEAEGPNGDFTLENPSQEFVFIAGGIGITPFRSILLDLDHKKIPIKGTLLYANRTPTPVYRQELEELSEKHSRFNLRYIVEPERITPETFQELILDFSKPQFFLSGPPGMVQTLERMLAGLGVPSSQVKEDYFVGYVDA